MGVTRELNGIARRRLILQNNITLFTAISVIIATFLIFKGLLPIENAYLAQFLFIIGSIIALYLNHKRKYLVPKIMIMLFPPIWISIYCFQLGPQSGWYLFFILSFIVVFLILTPEEKGLIMMGVFANLAAPVVVYIYYQYSDKNYNYQGDYSVLYASILLNTAVLIIAYVVNLFFGSYNAEYNLQIEREKSDELLHNILPDTIARELKIHGESRPVRYESVTVIFTDFVGFTSIAESLSPEELVSELDKCFSYFDQVTSKYNLEKLKTIGDSFMCAGGLPSANQTHALDCALAALEIQAFMKQMAEIKAEQGLPYWQLRLGMHTGPVVAGVVGQKKFAYDIWGDTVNTASRMESSGQAGKINISSSTFKAIENYFECEYRGKIHAKNKGEIEMHFLMGLKDPFARNNNNRVPNEKFFQIYSNL